MAPSRSGYPARGGTPAPDALVVWFDAHADSNLPSNSASGYLGGLVLTGAAGIWPTGLPSGLKLHNVVLVGARDIDPTEQALIDSGSMQLVKPGHDLADRLANAIGQRPVYVHLDCDVLEPSIVPTEYLVEGGLTLADLQQAAATTLAHNQVIGLEIAEFQACWPGSDVEVSPEPLIDALSPLLAKICSGVGIQKCYIKVATCVFITMAIDQFTLKALSSSALNSAASCTMRC